MTYSTYLASHLEEWIFLKYLEKYFLYVVIYLAVLIVVIMVLFIIPLCMLFFLYVSSFFFLIYQRTHKLQEDYSSNRWDNARLIVANKWDGFARFWHGCLTVLGVCGILLSPSYYGWHFAFKPKLAGNHDSQFLFGGKVQKSYQ